MKKVNMIRRHSEPLEVRITSPSLPASKPLCDHWSQSLPPPSSVGQSCPLLRMEVGSTHSYHLPITRTPLPSSPPHPPGPTPLTTAVLCPCPCPQHSQQLYRHIYLSCKEETNIQKHYEALYGLLALISIELANEEVMVDLIRLVLAVQVGLDVGRTR